MTDDQRYPPLAVTFPASALESAPLPAPAEETPRIVPITTTPPRPPSAPLSTSSSSIRAGPEAAEGAAEGDAAEREAAVASAAASCGVLRRAACGVLRSDARGVAVASSELRRATRKSERGRSQPHATSTYWL